MATLYFKVSSDWQEVVRLRQECEKLETQLKKMDSRTALAATKALETQLASTKQQMMGLVTEAAKAGAAVENDFKKKIYDASQTVNGLSEKIIAQRAVIKDIEFDVKRLGDAYRAALKSNPIGASGKLSEYNAARKALDEEKAALFGLTQQQAEARLSVKKLRDEYSLYKKEAGDTVEINNGLSVSWGKMLGVIGGVTALKQLGSEIVRVRGEFQSMQTAIETMVGKDMASTLIPQIKELAKVSPLTLSDMVNAEKMMLGFNIQAEDTIRYLQALSDISMGDGNKFKSLTLAFSQMSAAGKLMGQDLNQMINAGFNPLQIIAEKTGKSIATLKDEMSKGAVSAEMVQQAFIAATSAGGKFYQMSENASKTINGQLSMMQDALDAAFNEMGQASEGVIMGAIQATTSLIQNYETVGRVMAGLVVTYGAYRAAVMLSTVATSKHTIAEVALTNVRVLARKAQMALNAAMLTNPYVALATVITGLVATMWTLSDSTSQTEEATKRLNKSVSNVEGMASKEMSALKNLNKQLNEAKKGTDEWNKVKNQIVDGYSKYLPGIDKEIEKTGNLAGKYNELEVAIRKAAAARSFNEIERTENAKYQEIRDKNLEKAYDAFIESYGDESGLEIYKNFLGWLDSGKELPAEVQKAFSSVSVGWDKTANSLLFEIRKQDELRKQNLQKYKNIFGISDEDISNANDAGSGKETKTQADTLTEKERKELEKRKKARQKLSDELLSLQEKNQQDEIALMEEGTKKKLKQINADYEAQRNAIAKQSRDWAKENKEAGVADVNANGLTTEQQAEIDRANKLNEENQLKSILEVRKAEQEANQEAMNRYLKDYGTFQERKKAITDEYNQKIADASTDGEKLILQKQMEEALSDLDMEKLKDSINWELVFSDLGNASKKSLQQVKKQLEEFKSSGEYKNMAIDQKKVIDEALNNIQSAIIDKGGLLGDLPNQLEELRKAQEELTAAQDEYNEAMKNGTDEQKGAARRKLNMAEQNVANAQNNTDKAAKRTTDNLLTLADALTQLGSNTEMTLSEIGQLAGGIANAFSEAGSKIGGIIGAIFSILDQVGQEGLFGFLGNVFESVGNALTGVFDSLLGWTGIDFGGESDPTLEQDIERLTLANQELEKAINNLTEKMDDAAVADASSIYKIQKENIEEQMKNTQEMMRRSASASSDGFMGIGGHHATNTKINRGMTDADWKAISEAAGRTIDDAGDFFNLTSEEMWRVANEATNEYAKLKGLADDGYKDAAQFMDEYIEYWQELEELEEAYNEKLTSVSFDTVKDDFRNALLDMEDSTEAFADNFEKMMQQAILESMMTGTYDKALQEWYQDFADSMKDGTLDTDEQEMLRKQWQDIVDSASEEWQSWRDLMGWETGDAKEQQQQASAGYSVAASQDSVDVLNGRLNAVYEAELRIEKNGELMYNVADEMRGIIAQSYLELQQISENTGEIIKPIKQMQLDIAEVKKNTAKL